MKEMTSVGFNNISLFHLTFTFSFFTLRKCVQCLNNQRIWTIAWLLIITMKLLSYRSLLSFTRSETPPVCPFSRVTYFKLFSITARFWVIVSIPPRDYVDFIERFDHLENVLSPEEILLVSYSHNRILSFPADQLFDHLCTQHLSLRLSFIRCQWLETKITSKPL